MTFTIRKNSDPFKKYWWILLLVFGAIGGWICIPVMDTPIGAGPTAYEHGLKSADQSLDSMANPNGAPGQAVDLSMDGSYPKKKPGETDQMASSLYQAPAEAAAPGAPLTAGAGSASFADALKEVSKKAKADSAGWGGATPQKGFTAPKANFSGLSGTGSSTGGSGANFSVSPFGANVSKTAMTTTKGLGAYDPGSGKGGSPVMSSLKAAQAASQAAAMQKSADLAKGMSGGVFDGRGVGGSISADNAQGIGGSYADLDKAPMNLKANPTPPDLKNQDVGKAVATSATSTSLKDKIIEAVAMAVVSGVVGGMCNLVFGTGAGAAAGAGAGAMGAQMMTPDQYQRYYNSTH